MPSKLADYLTRIKRRVRVGWRYLQATSRYVLHVPAGTEFSGRPIYKYDRVQVLRLEPSAADLAAAQSALAARQIVIEKQLAMRRSKFA